MNEDLEHLRLLSIFHYVVAGLTALFACFPIFHLSIGVTMLAGNFFEGSGAPPGMPTIFGLMFVILPAAIMLLGWAYAVALAFAGRFLSRNSNYTYCLVIAAISCAYFPLGTALGVLTLIVLMRPTVKIRFGLPYEASG